MILEFLASSRALRRATASWESTLGSLLARRCVLSLVETLGRDMLTLKVAILHEVSSFWSTVNSMEGTSWFQINWFLFIKFHWFPIASKLSPTRHVYYKRCFWSICTGHDSKIKIRYDTMIKEDGHSVLVNFQSLFSNIFFLISPPIIFLYKI